MKKRLRLVITSFVTILISFGVSALYHSVCTQTIESSYFPQEQSPPRNNLSSPNLSSPNAQSLLANEQLEKIAESITVKVFSGQTSGSGIIIQKQGDVYTVVTNHHVLIFGNATKDYRIQTSDGETYQAQLINSVNFNSNDLELLQFRSQHNYPVATLLGFSNIVNGSEVFAAGFPSEMESSHPRGFLLTQGTVKMFSEQPFGGGYQIGYTNTVKKGMSGGPLLNRHGEVIGINGVHKYPLWGNPYVFLDGSLAPPAKKQYMSQLSWAIPIDTFLQLAPQFTPKDYQNNSRQLWLKN